jgi:hypothetical protein
MFQIVVVIGKELVTGIITLLLNIVTISCGRRVLVLGYPNSIIIKKKAI